MLKNGLEARKTQPKIIIFISRHREEHRHESNELAMIEHKNLEHS